MKNLKLFFLLALIIFSSKTFSQKVIEDYKPLKNDSLRIGIKDSDFLPFIQSGYTLMLPENKSINSTLIFLEDSGFDKKNKNSKELYKLASYKGFAVLSVSTEIPFDFYFTKASMRSTHDLIKEVFTKYKLPNKNVFFLGASLIGHRAMRYIKFMKENNQNFQLNIKGLVICNFTLDWTRKWHQHEREIRIKRNHLWEPKFINYMLETYLKGIPKTASENYHDFSSYSYFDEKNRNIKLFKNYAIRAYIEPAIKYRLTKKLQTLYENNSTDMVGFLAELELAGNKNTSLIVLQPEENSTKEKSVQTTWGRMNKTELLNWIQKQIE
ncbi:hypothetical protein WH52_02300 [Tenacibaculum holothuriorum]|uniref:Alpha/beta hydrolase n=1 Tax=Tenacibaculum holothuriorum TaxID=1635173 RepID=A0A1Y2PGC6_9FLAO|nr:hypothetical protein [Tenacibaculum holothuriorum]OSY89485.1 hypothetical protein WH52_02300 [Tenacibaculum holothuriorum]